MLSKKGGIRQVELLHRERIDQNFVPDDGLVDAPSSKGSLLVLTSQRLVAFRQQDDQTGTTMVPLDEIKWVSVRSQQRSLKTLFQGLALGLIGVLAYPLIGLFIIESGSPLIPGVLAAIIVVVGVLIMSRYFFGEEEGTISFMALKENGGLELNFPYTGSAASRDSYKVVNRFFQLKQVLEQNIQREDGGAYWPFT